MASKTYNKDMLQEDLEVGIRGLYQDNGYFEVNVDSDAADARGDQ